MPATHRCSSTGPATALRLALLPLAALGTTALVAGCYSPTLGDTPFVCASTGKECPDGYRCDKGKKVCVKDTGQPVDAAREAALTDAQLAPSKEGPVFVDGSVVQSSDECLDKAAEPNNTADTAFKLLNTGRIIDWEVCYAGDVDHYAIELSTGDKLTVRVLFKQANGKSGGDLDAALLNPDGAVIVTSRGTGDNETLELPTATEAGSYVVAVYGFGPATNRYDLDLAIE